MIVYSGKNDDWPYKVRASGNPAGNRRSSSTPALRSAPTVTAIGSKASIQKVKATKIELTYDNVKLNPDLADDEFAFTVPSNARVEDQTQAVVSMLDQAIALRAAQKKAEAAKGEDSVLKESIAVPPPTNPNTGRPRDR